MPLEDADVYHIDSQKDEKIMQAARDIVMRFKERDCTLPRALKPHNRTTPAEVQETKDAQKIKNWKKSFKNMPGQSRLPAAVKSYLDDNLTGWCDNTRAPDMQDPPLEKAKAIVHRYIQNGFEFPKRVKQKCQAKRNKLVFQQPQQHQHQHEHQILQGHHDHASRHEDEVLKSVIEQAQRDHDRLRYWISQEEKGNPTEGTVNALRYCDLNMPGWRDPELLYEVASDIFSRIVATSGSSNSLTDMDPDSDVPAEIIDQSAFCSWYRNFAVKSKEVDKRLLKGLPPNKRKVNRKPVAVSDVFTMSSTGAPSSDTTLIDHGFGHVDSDVLCSTGSPTDHSHKRSRNSSAGGGNDSPTLRADDARIEGLQLLSHTQI